MEGSLPVGLRSINQYLLSYLARNKLRGKCQGERMICFTNVLLTTWYLWKTVRSVRRGKEDEILLKKEIKRSISQGLTRGTRVEARERRCK